MYKIILLAVVIGAISAASDSEWAVFKAKHEKVYDPQVESIRRAIWEDNLEFIKKHNDLYAKGLSSYFMGQNEYADLTQWEIRNTMNGYKGPEITMPPTENSRSNPLLPSEVDWVKKGYVTEVKNQQQCGSCWAFSATGSLEGAHFKSKGKLVSLSEKNLMDCSSAYGNHGCGGGLMDNAFKYVIANQGIDTEASYPYVPKDGNCKYNPQNKGSTEQSYTDVTKGSENDLQKASATVGPISVAIDASHMSFQLYKGGVYDEPACSSTQLDHGVLAVGYGVHNGKDYWLVKNSWGKSWGNNGYIMMSRNKNNQCGIASAASYPTV